MADELIEQPEEMIEEAPEPIEGDPPIESESEPEQPAEAEPKPDDEMRALWDTIVPDIGYDDLSQDARIKVLLKRQAASAAGTAAKDGESATTADKPASQPPVPEFQPVDVDKIRSNLVSTFGDEAQANAILEPIEAALKYINGMAQLVQGRSIEIENTLLTFALPQEFRKLVASGAVKGATEADVDEATSIYRSGDVRNKETALKVAMLNRAANSSQPRTASDTAKRKAESFIASQQATPGSSKTTAPLTRIPQTEAEWREAMKREQQSKRPKK